MNVILVGFSSIRMFRILSFMGMYPDSELWVMVRLSMIFGSWINKLSSWISAKITVSRQSLSSSFSLCQGWGAARNFFTASPDSLFHPHLSLVFFSQSPSSPAFLTSLLTQSSHLSIGLPRLLLPSSRNYAALFGSLSSAILSTCPPHLCSANPSISIPTVALRIGCYHKS